MLMVILGAGASFDWSPTHPASAHRGLRGRPQILLRARLDVLEPALPLVDRRVRLSGTSDAEKDLRS